MILRVQLLTTGEVRFISQEGEDAETATDVVSEIVVAPGFRLRVGPAGASVEVLRWGW